MVHKKETEYHQNLICHNHMNMKFALVDFAQCCKIIVCYRVNEWQMYMVSFFYSKNEPIPCMCLAIVT